MRRFLLATILIATLAAPSWGAEDAAEPKLRNWHLGFHTGGARRSNYEVFARPGQPNGEVEERGRGGGIFFGRRFGERFLVDLQLEAHAHDIKDSETEITDVEALVTFSILFREREVLQPFLRGGFGGGGEFLTLTPDTGHIFSFGTTAIAGGGLQVRLSSRFSLELETVATFINFLEVRNESVGDLWPEKDWQVRESSWGWRSGLGVVFWF